MCGTEQNEKTSKETFADSKCKWDESKILRVEVSGD